MAAASQPLFWSAGWVALAVVALYVAMLAADFNVCKWKRRLKYVFTIQPFLLLSQLCAILCAAIIELVFTENG